MHWAASGGHEGQLLGISLDRGVIYIIFGFFVVVFSECAKVLLSVSNVEINVQNKLGDTPLHNAAWKGHAEVVAALLEKGITHYVSKYIIVIGMTVLQGP